MTYAVRNTLFIGAFWALIVAGGFFFVYGHQDDQLVIARRDNTLKRQRLMDLLTLDRDRSALAEQLSGLEDFRQARDGTLAAKESPGETFDYLLRELSRTNSRLEVNFTLKSQDSFLSLARRTYEIKGSGSFNDFYQLLCLLEEGPVFYDIHQMEMSAVGEGVKGGGRGDVTFTLSFNGYNRAEGPAITTISASSIKPPQIADLVNGRVPAANRGSFVKSWQGRGEVETPSVVKKEPPRNTEGLPEIDSSTKVLAIMPGAAVLKDHAGRTVRLRAGDRVWGGTLETINAQQGKLSFSMQDENGGATRLVIPSGSN
ncbi:MAG TPA: hypothetical protein PKY55_11750 [bacterium]|nr:hypothetical protein [bacterium]